MFENLKYTGMFRMPGREGGEKEPLKVPRKEFKELDADDLGHKKT